MNMLDDVPYSPIRKNVVIIQTHVEKSKADLHVAEKMCVLTIHQNVSLQKTRDLIGTDILNLSDEVLEDVHDAIRIAAYRMKAVAIVQNEMLVNYTKFCDIFDVFAEYPDTMQTVDHDLELAKMQLLIGVYEANLKAVSRHYDTIEQLTDQMQNIVVMLEDQLDGLIVVE